MEYENDSRHLRKYVSPLGAWAFAFGCSIGWGAFVMPGDTFLPVAGPWGTLIGFTLGVLLMIVLAGNYQYMIRRYPDSGGAYAFATRAFGSDHGFLAGWFLILAYIVVFWGNATALPMIVRNLLGDYFCFGFHYNLFGYDVYFGEALLSAGIMLVAAFACMRPRAAVTLQIIFAIILTLGVVICFALVMIRGGSHVLSLSPSFAPGVNPVSGIFSIMSLAPWAFVGFETISHSAEEFHFNPKKSFSIMTAALIFAAVTYCIMTLLTIAYLPDKYGSWVGYLKVLSKQNGLSALPAFASVHMLVGRAGTILMAMAAFAAIITGLIGFITASSRLLYSISLDGMLPKSFGRTNEYGVPHAAIQAILLISLPVPFLGRTAVNWLIDVTTVCVIIAYAYVSASAMRIAQREGDVRARLQGSIGLVISCIFAVVFLVPNLLQIRTLSAESYLLIAVWSILGLLWFRYRFSRGLTQPNGPSTMVWVVFLALIIYTSMIWVLQTARRVELNTTENIEKYYEEELLEELAEENIAVDRSLRMDTKYVEEEMKAANRILRNSSFIQISFIVVAMLIVFNIYGIMQKRAKQTEIDKARAEESSRAKSTFLSNMSHDIRTPMNAIVGMTAIASNHIDDKERVQDCLKKITISSKQLLGLINDVLDISKIESGKMTLNPEPLSLKQAMETICDIVRPQVRSRNQNFDIFVGDILCEEVYCDSVRLNQVLLNFLSNAMKFTPEGGNISIHLWQKSSEKGDGFVQTHFVVEDSGMGMSKEYQEKLFTAFEREDNLRVHKTQGTGLGLAISKYIVDAMGGNIEARSEAGVGTSFHVTVDLERVNEKDEIGKLPPWKILVVDDNEDICKSTADTLEELGAIPVTCQSGEKAIRLAQEAKARGDNFYAVLVDYKMEGMDGVETIKKLRGIFGEDMPACLISAYDWAEIEDEAREASVSGFIAKPLFRSTLYHSLITLSSSRENGDEQQESSDQQENVLEGKRILLAEDNDLNAEIAMMILEESGAKVEWAEDGKIATDMFEKSASGYYDAILMDLRMPHMNGLEATEAIRRMKRPDAGKIPIIAMTADAFAEDAQKCLAAGMNSHLTKPIDIEKLKSTLIQFS